MRSAGPPLPIDEALPGLAAALRTGNAAVLVAPPGAGKTTRVPLVLADEPWAANKKILVLEPRRLAARAAAARMASLVGERVGETIGYQIRFERKVSAATRIEVITEGLLTRRLQADPELPGVGLVIFDEFHERSLDADLALALTLDARQALRPELRVLVMSATLDTARVSALLGEAPVIESSGRLFPVEVRHAPPRSGVEAEEAMSAACLAALAEDSGDVLAFLPGAREIRAVQAALERKSAGRGETDIHALYGELSSAEQDAALAPAPPGRRKIILATNLAQTSLTIEGVTTVVDSGLVRVARFDFGAGADRLETLRVSRASADQRAGRAGRLGPGRCIRLWSRDQQAALPAQDTPEILAADLSRFALELAAWGADVASLRLMDAPPSASWTYAQELLRELGAIDAQGRITPHGRELVRLPTTPRRAHLLRVARDRGLADQACWIAAALEEREGGGDLVAHVRQFVDGRAPDAHAVRRVREAARQIARLVEVDPASRIDDDAVARLVSLAYPERIARRRSAQTHVRDITYLCEDGGEARLQAAHPLAQSEWLAIANWDPQAQGQSARRVRQAAGLSFEDLRRDHADRIRVHQEVRWDDVQEAVVAEEQSRLGAIVLERRPLRDVADEARRQAMLQGVRRLGVQALPWTDEARQWQARVLSLRSWRPDEDWADVSDEQLLATLEDWLSPYLDGVTRRDHLARLDLIEILEARFHHAARQRLHKLVPTHVEVPTGSRLRLHYTLPGSGPAAAPALEVRLQEMFGCVDTPRVNDGRVRIQLHLLSPARRPIAVTQDLAGFWARGYIDVKKEMKGRYPRHPWPDDPVNALPTRRAKPKGT